MFATKVNYLTINRVCIFIFVITDNELMIIFLIRENKYFNKQPRA